MYVAWGLRRWFQYFPPPRLCANIYRDGNGFRSPGLSICLKQGLAVREDFSSGVSCSNYLCILSTLYRKYSSVSKPRHYATVRCKLQLPSFRKTNPPRKFFSFWISRRNTSSSYEHLISGLRTNSVYGNVFLSNLILTCPAIYFSGIRHISHGSRCPRRSRELPSLSEALL